MKSLLKQIYDGNADSKNSYVLPTLIIDEMEEEQIWQQIELKNDSFFQEDGLKSISNLLSYQENKFTINTNLNKDDESVDDNGINDNEKDYNDEESNSEMVDEENENSDEDDEDDEQENDEEISKFKSSVDDQFFNLHEMHKFLDAEDKKESIGVRGNYDEQKNEEDDDDDDNEIDLFEMDSDNEESGHNIKYRDFFKPSKKPSRTDEDYIKKRDKKNLARKKMRSEDLGEGDEEEDLGASEQHTKEKVHEHQDKIEEESSDDEEENDAEKPKSSHEIKEINLKAKIGRMEARALREKAWQLKGEVDAQNRPINSLLEEILDFDSSVRPAPVITEETTMKLEDIIKQRIKDKAFDDVEKKIRPVETPQEYRKKLILSQEKNKDSLVKIYENEFIQKANSQSKEDAVKDVPKLQQEIKNSMKALFSKLDALSNFHYTPKQAQAEVKIITNTPAISLEEVTPAVVSTSNLLAPEEIRGKRKSGGDILGKDERTRTDKNRELRKKKMKLKYTPNKLDETLSKKQTKTVEDEKIMKKVVNQRNTKLVIKFSFYLDHIVNGFF